MITAPKLPPKAGYVEVEVDGRRTYRNVNTGVLIEDEIAAPTSEERIAALEEENHLLSQQVTALTDQNDFQEELIVELANIVYA